MERHPDEGEISPSGRWKTHGLFEPILCARDAQQFLSADSEKLCFSNEAQKSKKPTHQLKAM